ncbi:MAG: dynamin family protein [Candidatus Eremiobacteraeota bacterium]|nr:dynamin family protein [Candidatus Eremiobacteraeota bacterium]
MPEAPAPLLDVLDELSRLLGGDFLASWPQRETSAARLADVRASLVRRFTLAVVGEFSSGKSYLLNALLGKVRYEDNGRIAGLLATDINPSTATITELEFAPQESATARYPSGREERIPIDRLSRFVAVGKDDLGGLHDATGEEDAAPSFVTVRVASPYLERGFLVADTPGLASLNPAHRRATLAYLPRTDAVLYLIDTQQPFSEGDAAFLGLIGEHVRTIFIVQTKIDLWRMREADGREAWEHARERIVSRADRFAPAAEVFAVSAHDFARATLDADEALAERSGFPALLRALDRSLEKRAQAARTARALDVVLEIAAQASSRLRRDANALSAAPEALALERAQAERTLVERERALAREADDVLAAGAERERWISERGGALAGEATRTLSSAIDVADIERVRDRSRFHSLVDATLAPIFSRFAHDVSSDVALALDVVGRERPTLRVLDLAAHRLGGEAGTGAWSRDLAAGFASTIVLGAIGGPAVSFVHAVASAFAAHPRGEYMKRELGADLQASFFQALERDVAAFADRFASDVRGIYADTAAAVTRERRDLRAEVLGPLDEALALPSPEERERSAAAALGMLGAADAIGARASALRLTARADQGSVRSVPTESSLAEIAFDESAYDRGLRPERYRVVLLGALRRGKSSLIDALAGAQLLQDEAGREAIFPIHVRYGDEQRAFGLEADATWHEIPPTEAVARAARSPVLIEVPWRMPRQLVVVHAPAFDSGNPRAQEIALAAARAASEVLGLFSRQLSDRELDLYVRVAEFKKPMLLAHTIADNETPSERRNVVELAARYLRERGVPVGRIFTVSAHEFLEAKRSGRAPAAWNELGALRETLETHAEEHMRRLAERERRASELASLANRSDAASTRPRLRSALDRFLGRKES